MIQRLEISGVHMEVDEDLERYVRRKIGWLDRYVSRHSRDSMHAEIRLKESKAKDQKHCTCEVTIFLPHEVINTRESTINMYAAVDIVETKLKGQLRKYKELHSDPKFYQRIAVRLKNLEIE